LSGGNVDSRGERWGWAAHRIGRTQEVVDVLFRVGGPLLSSIAPAAESVFERSQAVMVFSVIISHGDRWYMWREGEGEGRKKDEVKLAGCGGGRWAWELGMAGTMNGSCKFALAKQRLG